MEALIFLTGVLVGGVGGVVVGVLLATHLIGADISKD